MGNQKRQLSVSFPSAFRQLSVSFPSAFRVTCFRLPVSGPLSFSGLTSSSALGAPARRILRVGGELLLYFSAVFSNPDSIHNPSSAFLVSLHDMFFLGTPAHSILHVSGELLLYFGADFGNPDSVHPIREGGNLSTFRLCIEIL